MKEYIVNSESEHKTFCDFVMGDRIFSKSIIPVLEETLFERIIYARSVL